MEEALRTEIQKQRDSKQSIEDEIRKLKAENDMLMNKFRIESIQKQEAFQEIFEKEEQLKIMENELKQEKVRLDDMKKMLRGYIGSLRSGVPG